MGVYEGWDVLFFVFVIFEKLFLLVLYVLADPDFLGVTFLSIRKVDLKSVIMFGTRYLGLRGSKLNMAVGIIAGMDFL